MNLLCEEFDVVLNTISCVDASSTSTADRLGPVAETRPVSLIPLCNRPLIAYQLDLMTKCGQFDTVFVVVETDTKSQVKETVDAWVKEASSKVDIRYVEISGSDEKGDLRILRALRGSGIKRDFFFLGCDVIVGDVLHNIADAHRVHSASITVAMADDAEPKENDKKTTKMKSKSKETKSKRKVKVSEYVGLVNVRDPVHRIVYAQTKDAFGEYEKLRVPKALLSSFPRLNIRADLRDARIYIFSSWILDLVKRKEGFSSIKEDLLPYLARRHERCPVELLAMPPSLVRTSSAGTIDRDEDEGADESMDGYQDPCKIIALVLSSGTNFSGRMWNVSSYLKLTRRLADIDRGAPWQSIRRGLGKSKGVDKALQKVLKDSVVVQDSPPVVGDRSRVRECTIGASVRIGSNVKLNNCVVMSGVDIADGCVIQNTILCTKVQVGEKCNLSDCQIGRDFQVPSKIRLNGEARSCSLFASIPSIESSPVLTGMVGSMPIG